MKDLEKKFNSYKLIECGRLENKHRSVIIEYQKEKTCYLQANEFIKESLIFIIIIINNIGF